MEDLTLCNIFTSVITKNRSMATAWINGNKDNPALTGAANFYSAPMGGLIVCVEVYGLPETASSFYGMHIHEFEDCTPPFDKTGSHYNPGNTLHPYHAGDLPPLLACRGYAWMAFYDNRFRLEEIIGRSIIIHSMRDDFTSQPAGDSGTKIGCGIIRKNHR
ncbi:MAG: superoxide dismutase family protein [Butyrivibrio sp.]